VFFGHYYHVRSGLHLAPFRAYDADLGRWLSRDPIAEDGGINLYAYCAGDPVNCVDPLGLAESAEQVRMSKLIAHYLREYRKAQKLADEASACASDLEAHARALAKAVIDDIRARQRNAGVEALEEMVPIGDPLEFLLMVGGKFAGPIGMAKTADDLQKMSDRFQASLKEADQNIDRVRQAAANAESARENANALQAKADSFLNKAREFDRRRSREP
jgi:RHS repeat-associated protein